MPEYEECFCCGKRVRIDKRHWRVHMLVTNEIVPRDFEPEDPSDSQGTFAVGTSCRKRYEHAFREEGF